MDFGRVSLQELEQIDFSLPADPAETKQVLAAGKGNTRFFIGCAKWGRKDWVGSLYPPGTREKDFLRYYAKVFNAIEFNGFYYNLHGKDQVRKWMETVPPGFLFCPKFTQYITHDKKLKGVQAELKEYLDVITSFGDNLGPVFLMPNPLMGPSELPVIDDFMASLPEGIKVFLELRQPEWYKSPNGYHDALYDMLLRYNRGAVITDAAGRRDCVHMHLSTPECFIRFVGNALHATDYQRIDDWVQRIKSWMDAGLERCYFFMHQHDELHSPQLIKYFIEELNRHCGTSVPPPQIHTGTLF
jgi:uncharacterized protein YecE (DUF72 family)